MAAGLDAQSYTLISLASVLAAVAVMRGFVLASKDRSRIEKEYGLEIERLRVKVDALEKERDRDKGRIDKFVSEMKTRSAVHLDQRKTQHNKGNVVNGESDGGMFVEE